jgi:hypothetical protein
MFRPSGHHQTIEKMQQKNAEIIEIIELNKLSIFLLHFFYGLMMATWSKHVAN